MKKLLLSAAILLATVFAFAQDKIYLPDGSVTEGRVLEVTQDIIKYKKASLPDGPVYTVSKKDVLMIAYANGEHEVINTLSGESTSSELPDKVEDAPFKRKRVIGFDLFQHYYRNVGFFIERIKSPLYAMRFTLYANYRDRDDREGFPIEYGFSVNPKFHVYNHEYVRTFLGPSFHHGVSRETVTNRYNPYNPYDYYSRGTETVWNWHESIMLEAGVSVNPVKNLDITLSGGFGYMTTLGLTGSENMNIDIDKAWKVGISIGGKF